jgi:hypothetical protein
VTSLISPLWRFLVTDLDGKGITLLDSLASDRMVTPKLSEPLEVSGTVPSDSDYVNRVHTDGFPLLAEGVRQLYCFRREEDTPPYYTPRASALIMQVDDASHSDDARSRFTAWDPWQYLFSRPVLQSALATVGDKQGVTGDLITSANMLYPATMTADEIVTDILFVMLSSGDVTAPAAALQGFVDWGLSGFYTGTIETCAKFDAHPPEDKGGFPIQQFTSVGQALLDLVSTGYLDLVFEPIYDPISRPGLLCQLSIYSQTVDDGTGEIIKLGAGTYRYSAVFAWDRPGRSMVGVDNLFDGVGRANRIQYFNGQGGPPVYRLGPPAKVPIADAASIATYGEYWTQQAFPAATQAVAIRAVAGLQLALRKTFKETLTVNPAPERSPEPFVDYYLGDGVRVFVSDNMRQDLTGWQRIYGIPVEIDDNGVETVRELLVGPIGEPPPVGEIVTEFIQSTVGANRLSRTTNRTGAVGAL